VKNNPNRPLGILVISIFYLFGAVVLFISMFTNYVGVAEQITLVHGLPLNLKLIVLPSVAILAIGISYGLFSLSRWGYYLTIIYLIYFGAISLLLSMPFGNQTFMGNFMWSVLVMTYLLFKRRIFIQPGMESKSL
jgi:hypothetical protein